MNASPGIYGAVSPLHLDTIVQAIARDFGPRYCLDSDDLAQDIHLRLLRYDRKPKCRFNPERGRSPRAYINMVARGCVVDRSRHRRARPRPTETVDGTNPVEAAKPITKTDVEQLMSVLDLEEERQCAMLLIDGATIPDIQKALGMKRDDAAELRTRVRCLLLSLDDGDSGWDA